MNTSPAVLEFTSSMFAGASLKKPALALLSECLREIYRDKKVDDSFIELTAQVIAASTFGLIIRLILEKDTVSGKQREKLVNHYLDFLTDGLVPGSVSDKGSCLPKKGVPPSHPFSYHLIYCQRAVQ